MSAYRSQYNLQILMKRSRGLYRRKLSLDLIVLLVAPTAFPKCEGLNSFYNREIILLSCDEPLKFKNGAQGYTVKQ